DINGVCSVGGTRWMSSYPRKVASVNTMIPTTSASVISSSRREAGEGTLDRPHGSRETSRAAGSRGGTHRSAEEHGADDLVVGIDDERPVLQHVLQQGQHVPAEHLARVER